MIIFGSIPTMLLLILAAAMTVWGAVMQKDHVPAFFGACFGALAVLSGLIDGAAMKECLLYVLVLLILSAAPGKGDDV